MDSPTLVLVAPQDIVNIASAVRICRNFGITDLRLVSPAIFDPWRIEGIAHNTAELVEKIRIFDTLDAAVEEPAPGGDGPTAETLVLHEDEWELFGDSKLAGDQLIAQFRIEVLLKNHPAPEMHQRRKKHVPSTGMVKRCIQESDVAAA